jgi:hypothetical protein
LPIIPQDAFVPERDDPRGSQRLTDPVTNKGTAFTADERRRFHLEGRLPPRGESLEEQSS